MCFIHVKELPLIPGNGTIPPSSLATIPEAVKAERHVVAQLNLRERPRGQAACIENCEEILIYIVAVNLRKEPTISLVVSSRRKYRFADKMPGTEAEFLTRSAIHIHPRHPVKNPVARMAAGKISIAVFSQPGTVVDHRKLVAPGIDGFLAQC